MSPACTLIGVPNKKTAHFTLKHTSTPCSKSKFDLSSNRSYVYKMTVDNGGAPCVYNGLLSLAICKPVIRRRAEVGSWVFGFGSKQYQNKLIFIAQVTERVVGADYYSDCRWNGRPDRIYRLGRDGQAILRPTARYHTLGDQLEKDVGLNFENSQVLISDNFRYLGQLGTDAYKTRFPALAKMAAELMQGHRVNHSAEVMRQLTKLQLQIWRSRDYRLPGVPSEKNFFKVCNK